MGTPTENPETKESEPEALAKRRARYAANPATRARQSAYFKLWRSRHQVRKSLRQLKESTPCADCGQKYPHYVMDFDHLPGMPDKVAGICDMIRRHRSHSEIEAEIRKCELVCANCHRIRTHKRARTLRPQEGLGEA